jgi:uncharacterized OB-fold protein
MTRRFDRPTIELEHAAWWQAAQEHRLLLRRCRDCGASHFYPRPFCPVCWSTDVDWEQASGVGRLYTWSVVRSNGLPPFSTRVPYVAALVDLAEGPRMMTNVVQCQPERLACEQPLEVVWEQEEEVTVPRFRPFDPGSGRLAR